jgi:hypothetical protein
MSNQLTILQWQDVDLLDALDRLDVQLLESGLELLVIGAGVADDLLDRKPTLAFNTQGKEEGKEEKKTNHSSR